MDDPEGGERGGQKERVNIPTLFVVFCTFVCDRWAAPGPLREAPGSIKDHFQNDSSRTINN